MSASDWSFVRGRITSIYSTTVYLVPAKWKALSKHSTKEAGNKQGQEKERGGRALFFFGGGSPAGRLLRVQPCPEAQEGNLGDKMLL